MDFSLTNYKRINYFYTRNFLGIDKEKASQFSKEKILSSQKYVNNCNTAMKIVTIILFLPLICVGGAAGAGAGGASDSGNFGIAILSIFGIYAIPASIIYFILSIIIFVNLFFFYRYQEKKSSNK